MKLQVTSAAQRDLVEAYSWYEAQAHGLGKAMIATVDAAFDFIQRHPRLPRITLRDLRRLHTKRFPYVIYYTIPDEETVRIIAVFHTARDRRNLTSRA
jgi:plasmid stabilization system protein ParE